MRKYYLIYAVLLFVGLLLIYSPVVFDSRTLGFDDPIVVEPMKEVHNLSDYLKLKSRGVIWDIQPVRDFSLWINSNHSGNLVIWFIVSLLVLGCLSAVYVPTIAAMGLATLFAFNPVVVSSVGWLSARKHLLSAGFTVALTLVLLLECRKNEFLPRWSSAFGFVVLFLLAGFSQPINILWPFFAGIYVLSRYRGKIKIKHGPTLLSLMGLGLSGVWLAYLNYNYYKGAYSLTNHVGKYTSENYNNLFWKIWCFGRIFFQLVLPIRTPASGYDPLSWLSGIGILLFVLTAYILVRTKFKDGLCWLVGIVLAVSPILIQMTNVYAVDNYVLYAVFCFFMLLGTILKKLEFQVKKSYKIFVGVLVLIAGVFSVRSFYLASSWNNDFALWEMSYKVEPTAKSAIEYAAQLLLRGEPAKAMALAIESKNYMGKIGNGNAVLSRSIYENSELTINKKIEMLTHDKNEWSLYYIAALFAAEGKISEACTAMTEGSQFAEKLEFQDDSLETMAAESLFFCKNTPEEGERIVTAFKSVRRNKKWDQQKFADRAKQLGVLK